MCRSLVVDSLAENTTISTTRSSNLSPYRILHHHPNVMVPVPLRWHGSDLTSHHSLLVSRFAFRSTLYVFVEIPQTSRSLVPLTGRNSSHPSSRAPHLDPHVDQNFHLVLSFSLAHQAARVGRRLCYPAACSRRWAVRAGGRRHGC